MNLKRGRYYLRLRKVTEREAWEGWIHFLVDRIEQTSRKDCERMVAIDAGMKEMGQMLQPDFLKYITGN